LANILELVGREIVPCGSGGRSSFARLTISKTYMAASTKMKLELSSKTVEQAKYFLILGKLHGEKNAMALQNKISRRRSRYLICWST